jgi:hypothetical protein
MIVLRSNVGAIKRTFLTAAATGGGGKQVQINEARPPGRGRGGPDYVAYVLYLSVVVPLADRTNQTFQTNLNPPCN